MIYEITIQSEEQDDETPHNTPLQIQAGDWFTAMREGLPKMGESIANQELEVTLLGDKHSAVVHDQKTKRKIFVLAINRVGQPAEEASPDQGEREHIRFESQPIPVMPSLKPDTFSLNGAYIEGATTDFLTEAFMKVGDLYGSFGDDLEAAMTHLFAMLKKATRAEGGGLLLSDINDPLGQLRFAYALGEQRDLLYKVLIPKSGNVIGYCAQHNTKLNIETMATASLLANDPLCRAGLSAGPALCVPISYQGQLLGVVMLYKLPGTKIFSPGEVNIFSYLSDAIGQYLHLRAESLQN